MSKVNIFWFRRDLRLEDNIGLLHASKSGTPFLPVFIFDKTILSKLKNRNDKRVQFIHDNLRAMKEKLKDFDSDLIIYYDSPENAWRQIMSDFDIAGVYSNEDYEPYALKRDAKISSLLEKNDIDFHQFKDQCIFAKNDVLKKDGKPYTVYTPFKNAWYARLQPEDLASVSNKRYLKNLFKIKQKPMIELKDIGFNQVEVGKLNRSIRVKIISEYGEKRDIPSLKATSELGIHLRFGTVSIRKCAQMGYHSEDKTWLSELIWRDFFMQILFHFPHVEKKEFKPKYEKIQWRNSKSEFKKWCDGMTGYPLIDAGIRQLNETGNMHNRVRMVVASFLVKHLLIDWKWGERYFAEKLLDYDLSANNGNWQWVAGTGCDSAPYFRIFNPETQLKRFDSELKYVLSWVPEYGTSDYPEPMVDHKMAYQRCLVTYKRSME